jgi:hypothetical protein
MKVVVPRFTHSDGYWQLLDHHWQQRHSFIVREADKHPSEGALEALWACPEPWCTYPIPMQNTDRTSPYASLGCTKFHRVLMDVWPDLMRDAGELGGMGLPPEQAWSRLDLAVAGLLEHRFGPVHWHPAGMVEHRHEVFAVA